MIPALFALIALSHPGSYSAPAPASPEAPAAAAPSTESAPALASFYPVCRDDRGAWDRRACRHVRRSDPKRLLLV